MIEGEAIPPVGGCPVRFRVSTVLVRPGRLPVPHLASPLLPVLVHPKPPHHLEVVPCEFWPDVLRDVLAREH